MPNKIYLFVMSKEQPDGGFSFAGTNSAALEETYYALQIIHEIGETYKSEKTRAFLMSQQDKNLMVKHLFQLAHLRQNIKIELPYLDRAIQQYPFKAINNSESYFAAKLAQLINKPELTALLREKVPRLKFRDNLLDEVCQRTIALSKLGINFNKELMAKKIQEFQGYDGAFSFKVKGSPSFIEETYLAIEALSELHQSPNNINACESFINSCKAKNGGYGRQAATVPTLEYTYKAIIALKMLNEMKEWVK